jgi:tetratricopeptide (TPR) repeat protein
MNLPAVFKSISRCLKVPAFLLLALTATASADPVLDMADSLMAAGFYDDAVTEYRRFLFFNEPGMACAGVYSRLGYCYAYMGEYREALDAADNAALYAGNDSLASVCRTDRAVILAAAGEYDSAATALETVLASEGSETVKSRAGMLLIMTRVLQHDWSAARDIFDTLPRGEYAFSDSVTALLERAVKDRHKSPGKAELLSTLVPGTGQIYNGHWLSGLNALVLNVALGWLTVDLVSDREYVPAFLSYIFLFQRYYNGNRGVAYEQAVEHNRQQDLFYEKEILKLIKELPSN